MRYLSLLICLLWAAGVLADGLPIIDGKIDKNIEYTMLDLDKSQVEEVQALGTLTLSSDQWSNLKKVGPQCPKRFTTLLPSDYHDCTCGETGYAILFPNNKAAIIHSVISNNESGLKAVFQSPQPDVFGSIWDSYHSEHLSIIVDAKGQLFLGGMMIPFEQTKVWLALPQTEFRDGKLISIPNNRSLTLKLAMGSKPTQKAINRVIEYRQAALDAGWKVDVQNYAGWGLKYNKAAPAESRDDLSSDTAIGK